MGKKIRKGAAKVRKQLDLFHESNTVQINVKELKTYLDRLEKLEKREAERKEKKALAGPIKAGDRVELVDTFEVHLWPYAVKGAQGTVKCVREYGTNRVRVVLDNWEGHPLSFNELEIRKIA